MTTPRRLVVLAFSAGALVLACTGLFVDKGNEYPCDFSAPEGERDRACTAGWVCSVTNTCRRFTNEGPQFEGNPTLPTFDGGRALAPVYLQGAVRGLTPLADEPSRMLVGVDQDGGELFAVSGAFLVRKATLAASSAPLALVDTGLYLVRPSGELLYQETGANACLVQGWVSSGGTAPTARVGGSRELGYRVSVLRDDAVGRAGELLPKAGGPLSCARFRPFELSADGGSEDIEDVRWVDRALFQPLRGVADGGERVVPVAVTHNAVYFRSQVGGIADPPAADNWTRLTVDEDLALLATPNTRSSLLRHDPSGTAWAIASSLPEGGDGGHLVFDGELRGLTVLRLTRTPGEGARLSRAFSDCRPCAQGRILALAPVVNNAGLSVEVLCEGSGASPDLSAVRVVDSVATDRTRPCQVEALRLPIDLKELSVAPTSAASEHRSYAIDQSLGAAVLFGGRHGQLWLGSSLSHLDPLHLDRVPRAVGTALLPADAGMPIPKGLVSAAGGVPVALTDRYLAAPLSENGLGALPLEAISEAALPTGAAPSAPVGEATGWLALTSGDLAFFGANGRGELHVQFGPRLLTPQGDPAGPPHFAEAVAQEDGGVVAVIATAGDSLYHLVGPLQATAHPNAQPAVSPQLTPEPSFPIRSMTLERSPLGTDGKSFVRGYLVTSRNLYEFSLSGQPPRWSARQILLAAGEPVEVWMDHPKGGLGRVGFRDGTVFTLPGGFPLVQGLPMEHAPDGGADRVLDYGNLGGWPVALARSGLYVATWDVLPDGSVDRNFPDGGQGKTMRWRRVALPGGSEPWRGSDGLVSQGLLEVARLPPQLSGGKQLTTFVLRLWGPLGRVWEVGSMTRVTSAR